MFFMCVIKAEANDTKTAEIIKDKNCEKRFLYEAHSQRTSAKDIGRAKRNIKNFVLCH
jgi:hypothetical protein